MPVFGGTSESWGELALKMGALVGCACKRQELLYYTLRWSYEVRFLAMETMEAKSVVIE